MELKLNIYKDKKIEKTYTTNDFVLMTGTCEDILKLVNIDKFAAGLNDPAVDIEIFKIVIKAFKNLNPLMKEIFEGLTDDEYNRTAIKEVAFVVKNVVMFTVKELFNISNSKN